MRRIITRQAQDFMTRLIILLSLALALGLSACTPFDEATPTPTPTPTTIPSTLTPAPSATPSPVPTATPETCLGQPGRVLSGAVETTSPAQEFLIYLPPCYDQETDEHYPVLYLLHGQLQTDDEWVVHLGAAAAADDLIHSGEAAAFIMVFPDDRYWNLQAGSGFGDRLINSLIPYVDRHFRTLDDRDHRALGGLSRGGGWTVKLGLVHHDLFSALGLNSPAIFAEDSAYIERWVRAIPSDSWPRVWIDAGDRDKELGSVKQFENLLNYYEIPHEWRMYTGDHSESYWRAHVAEYLQWYTDGWKPEDGGPEDPTPQP
jgi:enterochelin esterase-like enzyme